MTVHKSVYMCTHMSRHVPGDMVATSLTTITYFCPTRIVHMPVPMSSAHSAHACAHVQCLRLYPCQLHMPVRIFTRLSAHMYTCSHTHVRTHTHAYAYAYARARAHRLPLCSPSPPKDSPSRRQRLATPTGTPPCLYAHVDTHV